VMEDEGHVDVQSASSSIDYPLQLALEIGSLPLLHLYFQEALVPESPSMPMTALGPQCQSRNTIQVVVYALLGSPCNCRLLFRCRLCRNMVVRQPNRHLHWRDL